MLRPADRRCRLSDDSWAVLLPALLADNHALLAAQRIQRAFRDELALDTATASSARWRWA